MQRTLEDKAVFLLKQGWGTIYEDLVDLLSNPTPDKTKLMSWYIDDRANPKDFWALLSLGHPDLYRRYTHKKIKKTYVIRAVNLIFDAEW